MDQAVVMIFPILLAVVLVCLQEAWRMRIALQGYRMVTLDGSSNMKDEMDPKYAKPLSSHKDSGDLKWKVKALYIHPIKSCAGVELDVAEVDGSGLTWDRKFAFAELIRPPNRPNASDADRKPQWIFRTLRQPGWERLALVKPEIWLPGPTKRFNKNQGWMIVRYPHIPAGLFAPFFRLLIYLGVQSGERSFKVPLFPPPNHKYQSEDVKIWKDFPSWLNYGVHVPSDFAPFIGVSNPVTLFRVDPNSYREVYRCAPRKEHLGYQPVVGFADAYPVHLLNISSVRDIAGRVRKDISRFSARRFRSNILIEGPGAFNEDDWKKVRIGKHVFHCACRTVRCRLPNVDPDTAERHPVEPDKTLKSFRCIDEGDPLNACLGLQLVPEDSGPFQVHAGDEVEVMERGHHLYQKQ